MTREILTDIRLKNVDILGTDAAGVERGRIHWYGTSPSGTTQVWGLSQVELTVGGAQKLIATATTVMIPTSMSLTGGDLTMNSGYQVVIQQDPATANHATRKSYVDDQAALKVSKAGDTMSGFLNMAGNPIQNLPDPGGTGQPVTLGYLQAKQQSGVLSYTTVSAGVFTINFSPAFPSTTGLAINITPQAGVGNYWFAQLTAVRTGGCDGKLWRNGIAPTDGTNVPLHWTATQI